MSQINIPSLVIGLIIGAIVIIVLFSIIKLKKVKEFFINLKYQANGLKRYWIFVIPFILLYITTLVLVLYSSAPQDILNTISNLTQIFILTFAVFVGYFAFLENSENQFEKIKAEAINLGRSGKLLKAKKYYIKANRINSKEQVVLLNLIEILILIDDNTEAKRFIKFAEQLFEKDDCIDDGDRTKLLFLKALLSIFNENSRTADDAIEKLVAVAKEIEHKDIWGYQEIQKSSKFADLKGEAKVKLNNLIFYLEEKLDPEQKKAFEAGTDYSLVNYKPNANVASPEKKS